MAIPNYQRNKEALQQAYNKDKEATNNDGISWFSLPQGKTMLRILPPWNEQGFWYFEYFEHYFKSANTYKTCPKTNGEACPICEYGAAIADSGNAEGAKAFKPGRKYLVNALVLSDAGGKISKKDGVHAVTLPYTVKKAILDLDMDYASGYGDVTDLANGYNISIDKSGAGLNTEYSVKASGAGRSNIDAELRQENIDPQSLNLYPLHLLRKIDTYDALNDFLHNLVKNAPQDEPVPVKPSIPTMQQLPTTPLPKIEQPVTNPMGQPVVGVAMTPVPEATKPDFKRSLPPLPPPPMPRKG